MTKKVTPEMADRQDLEYINSQLCIVLAKLSLAYSDDPESQDYINSARRMTASSLLRLNRVLRGF